jgi:hypothetical protein
VAITPTTPEVDGDGRARARLDDADHRDRQLLLQHRQRRRGGGVAGHDEHLDVAP